ncbi:hypothetical protein C8Q80DRAFT_1163986 [Daedaleopsis nitida]|nr:hypothetical protein C8Q80DRAFT_1163986 [Daedaleopsis nitida]
MTATVSSGSLSNVLEALISASLANTRRAARHTPVAAKSISVSPSPQWGVATSARIRNPTCTVPGASTDRSWG